MFLLFAVENPLNQKQKLRDKAYTKHAGENGVCVCVCVYVYIYLSAYLSFYL